MTKEQCIINYLEFFLENSSLKWLPSNDLLYITWGNDEFLIFYHPYVGKWMLSEIVDIRDSFFPICVDELVRKTIKDSQSLINKYHNIDDSEEYKSFKRE